MGQSLGLVFPFCERQVFLSGSIFSPFSNRFSYCVHNEVETVHLGPHTTVDSPDRPGTMLVCFLPVQGWAPGGTPYKTY